jgi:hypothetical protein
VTPSFRLQVLPPSVPATPVPPAPELPTPLVLALDEPLWPQIKELLPPPTTEYDFVEALLGQFLQDINGSTVQRYNVLQRIVIACGHMNAYAESSRGPTPTVSVSPTSAMGFSNDQQFPEIYFDPRVDRIIDGFAMHAQAWGNSASDWMPDTGPSELFAIPPSQRLQVPNGHLHVPSMDQNGQNPFRAPSLSEASTPALPFSRQSLTPNDIYTRVPFLSECI